MKLRNFFRLFVIPRKLSREKKKEFINELKKREEEHTSRKLKEIKV